MDAILVTGDVVVPASALEMKGVRSGGPGGQNVNKVASKVELRVELGAIRGLSSDQRARLDRIVLPRLGADGRLLVTSSLTRDQGKNLEDAREKVRLLVEKCLRAPARRIATRPSRAAKARRVDAKKHEGRKKAIRRSRDSE